MTSKVNKFCIQGGHVLLPSGETQETDIVILVQNISRWQHEQPRNIIMIFIVLTDLL